MAAHVFGPTLPKPVVLGVPEVAILYLVWKREIAFVVEALYMLLGVVVERNLSRTSTFLSSVTSLLTAPWERLAVMTGYAFPAPLCFVGFVRCQIRV
jgi:hypothetical protein